MENYTLKENETVLYRGTAIIMPDGKNNGKDTRKCDLWLTNLSIVIFTQKRKLMKTVTEVESYDVADVKIYNDSVQVIRRKSAVDVYLRTGELFIDFEKEKEAKSFCDKALRLISGESKFVRAVKKGRKEINETNEALDIDVASVAAKGVKTVAKVASGAAALEGAGKKAKFFGMIGDLILNKPKNGDLQSLPEGKENTQEENSSD